MGVLRIGNCSGFYGDRFSAMHEMLTGGELNVLTGDYLAELTMSILRKTGSRRPDGGYARTFLSQLEECLGEATDRGVRIVVNAGGHTPGLLATDVRALAARLGFVLDVAHIEGDDILGDLPRLQSAGVPLRHLDDDRSPQDAGIEFGSANAYLGSRGIAAALTAGAQVVVCPRVTDASLVVGPARWHFGWDDDDYDALAGAIVTGHVLECGPQATGGNYAFFEDLRNAATPGYPLAEIRSDGSAVITKHPGTGGIVDQGTVTAQLLYEIGGPGYLNPDAVAHFDTVELTDDGPDRVVISGVRGSAPPPDLKVCATYRGGYRNSMTVVLTSPAIEEKAALFRSMLADSWSTAGSVDLTVRLQRFAVDDPPTQAGATALLTLSATSTDADLVGRRFADAVVGTGLATYPGMYMTAPPQGATAFDVLWPTLVPVEHVAETVVLDDGTRLPIAPPRFAADVPADLPIEPVQATDPDARSSSDCTATTIGAVFGARSGDKGGNANLGIWARDEPGWQWLRTELSSRRLRALLPEIGGYEVRRYEFPRVRALNFVIVGLLGQGVSGSTRLDPQAKALGEFLRSRPIALPRELLDADDARVTVAP